MSTDHNKPVLGLIGLGATGGPMAVHLSRAGYPLAVYNLDGGPVWGCDAGSRVSTGDNRPASSYWRELMAVRREDAPDADAG